MRTSSIVAALALGALVAVPAFSQTTPPPAPAAPGVTAPSPATPSPSTTAPMRQAPTARTKPAGDPVTGMRASKIIGSKVKNSAGENVGSVDDLIIREKDQVVLAVISVGGFLGMGDRKVAVPWSELTLNSDRTVVYNVTKDELKTKPEFEG